MALPGLKDKGWFVSENTLDIELDLAEESDRLNDPRRLEEFLLNIDLKEIGDPILYEKFDRKKGELIGPIILQLTKWRNISYPSVANHDKNDGVCTMTLSDGHGSVKTCSIDPIKIDGTTPYGSKVLLSGKIRSENGFLLLNSRNTTLLGGTVETLVEKWQTERFAASERKTINAPRWVPFSKAKNLNIRFDKNFSSLGQNVDGDEKEVDEKTAQFNATRQAQIEALNVPAPKPVKEVTDQMKNVSLNEPQPSRSSFEQRNQGRDNFRNDQPPRQNSRNDQRNEGRGNFRDNQPPRQNFRSDQPSKQDIRNDQPPRQNFRDNQPPRQNFRSDQPPRQKFRDDQPSRQDFRDDQPPRQNFRNDQPPRQDFRNDQPSRQDFRNDQPPRQNFKNERGRRGGSSRGNENRPQRNERQFDNQHRPQADSGENFPREFRPSQNRGGQPRGNRGNSRGQRGSRPSRGGPPERQQNSYNAYQQQQSGPRLNLEMDFPSL